MSDPKKMSRKEKLDAYWRLNQRLIVILLIVWFVVAYVPPMFVTELNQIVIAGFPLGYYMGSQGSLIVFVLLIFGYAFYMNKLDDEWGMHEK